MKTLGYVKCPAITDIEVGQKYYFGELVDGSENLEELLDSKCVAIYDKEIEKNRIVDFEIFENSDNTLDVIVKVTGVY